MGKTRVHELAAEFGVSAEQLMALLKEMNIFVRSHMSALEPEQVAPVRVRWEREKRKAAEPEKPKKGRRKAAAKTPAAAPVAEAKPVKRRRTAAEVAKQEAILEAERQREAEIAAKQALFEMELPPGEDEKPALPASLEERAKLLFKDLPPAAPESETEAAAGSEPAAPVAPRIP
ncbi:MAG: translation initiation factor IF-2 N-terminal domain-containing protein, partial [Gemmatimonadales bacterium]